MVDVHKISVIGDDKINLKIACNILGNKYLVQIAYDGETGLAKAYEIIPNLIFLYVEILDLNGYEVCDQLKPLIDTQNKSVDAIIHRTNQSNENPENNTGSIDIAMIPK